MVQKIAAFTFLLLLFFSCDPSKEPLRFKLVDPSDSGLDFTNTITENDTINVVKFQYCYNGGGVGIGDFNNDELPDIVLTGNQVSSKLYLNKGNLSFEDISKSSGFHTDSWVTGVSIVDINADGWEDIYLSVGGANCDGNCNNLLFVNQGNGPDGTPVFKEEAEVYGLDDGGYGQQSVFFDYDDDGDLDVFILRNGNSGIDKNNPVPKRYMPPHLKDLLLRNDQKEGIGHPVYTNVSESIGIVHGGFGLGLGINDFNNDGLIDIYVANDFITDDLLYIQKRHADSISPWFKEMAKNYLPHTTYNSMGADFNDLNDDALPDILVVDMLPEIYERQKKMLGMTNYEKYLLSLRNDYNAQYVRNTLQLHNGMLEGEPLKTSEVAFLKGIATTDWSWAPLMIDLDNDADKDIYISNGYVKDVADLDYINYSSKNNLFGSREERIEKQIEFTKELDSIYLPNFIYENDGQTNFEDVSQSWAKERPSYSNGVAYADLDLDGDLDLVVNNINEKAFLMENKTSDDPDTHYLRLKLKGTDKNPHAIGSKITLWNQGKMQHHFQSVIRGYLSSVEPIVHFGIQGSEVDSVLVKWPNGKQSILRSAKADQVLQVNMEEGVESGPALLLRTKRLFNLEKGIIDHVHEENNFNEYTKQHLLTKQYSSLGPCVAAADIDGRPGDEIFIGGSKGKAGQIWFQNAAGTYEAKQELDPDYEDTDAVFVDIDGDNDLDLFVASGSTEYEIGSEYYQDRLYLNDGQGVLKKTADMIPEDFTSSHFVRPMDFDHDGDMDLFVGSRIVPGKYPKTPRSKVLINEGGRFVERPELTFDTIGMVTDAVWADIDHDGWEDLTLVGEWMPITVLKNKEGKLVPAETTWSNDQNEEVRTEGWWNCIATGDFDDDGDMDFIIGNQGLNTFMRPSQDEPLYAYKEDFDNNGSPDPVLARYYNIDNTTKLMPLHTRDDIMAQLVGLKKKYLNYDAFTAVDFEGLLNINDLEAETYRAYTFASSYVENLGDGNFKITPLAKFCQTSTINDVLVDDFNADGKLDALLVGNDFSAETLYGKYDALTGSVLLGSEAGFDSIGSAESGFYVPGQSHHLEKFKDADGNPLFIVTQNDTVSKVFSIASD